MLISSDIPASADLYLHVDSSSEQPLCSHIHYYDLSLRLLQMQFWFPER